VNTQTTLPAYVKAAPGRVETAATSEARRLGAAGAIAIGDDGGNLVDLERLDQTFSAASVVAIERARTAATFRRRSRNVEQPLPRDGR